MDVNRRSLLHAGLGLTLAPLVGRASATAVGNSFAARRVGFNLIAWNAGSLSSDRQWKRAIDEIHALGVGRVTLVPYKLFSSDSGTLVSKSRFDLVSGPVPGVIARIVRYAVGLGLSVSIKPMIEIDNEDGEGEIWRGTLRLDEEALAPFFETYERYILDMCRVGVAYGATRFYIGSELVNLVKDKATHSYWEHLIAGCRDELRSSRCLLSYAANFSEYEDVPFWQQLDEIGIDAYFPIATEAEAQGLGRPGKAALRRRIDGVLARLRAYSVAQGRPIMLAEWGVVPFDLTTTDPSSDEPSDVDDPEEAFNAYAAMIEAVGAEGDWLTGIDFWHWRVDPKEDSSYRLDSRSPVIKLLRGA